MVVFYHYFGIKIINGHYGVVLFFVLSGFLITYLLLDEKKINSTINIKKFYFRRIFRIWPLYFLILIISSLNFLINNSFSELLNIIPFFILFIPNVAFALGIGLKYASILWSIGSEEQFYLIWPWLLKGFKTRNFIIINLIIIIVWTIGPHILDFINYNYLNEGELMKNGVKIMTRISLNSMATGAIFACILFQKNNITKILYSISLQLINIILIIFLLFFKILPFLAFVDQIYAFLFGILIINLAGNKKTIINLENKWLNYLGKISFGIYVFHLIMIDLTYYLATFIDYKINNHLLLIFSLTLTIILSSISYTFFEKPFIVLKNKYFSYEK